MEHSGISFPLESLFGKKQNATQLIVSCNKFEKKTTVANGRATKTRKASVTIAFALVAVLYIRHRIYRMQMDLPVDEYKWTTHCIFLGL